MPERVQIRWKLIPNRERKEKFCEDNQQVHQVYLETEQTATAEGEEKEERHFGIRTLVAKQSLGEMWISVVMGQYANVPRIEGT